MAIVDIGTRPDSIDVRKSYRRRYTCGMRIEPVLASMNKYGISNLNVFSAFHSGHGGVGCRIPLCEEFLDYIRSWGEAAPRILSGAQGPSCDRGFVVRIHIIFIPAALV